MKKKLLVAGIAIIVTAIVFSVGVYAGTRVAPVEPIVIETGEGFQDITTLPAVLDEDQVRVPNDKFIGNEVDENAEDLIQPKRPNDKFVGIEFDEDADDLIQPR